MAYTYDQRAKYAHTHAWVRLEGELAVIGVSECPNAVTSCDVWGMSDECETTFGGPPW